MSNFDDAQRLSAARSRIRKMCTRDVLGYLDQHCATVDEYPSDADQDTMAGIDDRNRERAARYMAGLNEQNFSAVLVIVSPSGEGMMQTPDTPAGRAGLASWLDLYRKHRGSGYHAERWTLTAVGDTVNIGQPTHREPVAL